jgi:hypothetical protein
VNLRPGSSFLLAVTAVACLGLPSAKMYEGRKPSDTVSRIYTERFSHPGPDEWTVWIRGVDGAPVYRWFVIPQSVRVLPGSHVVTLDCPYIIDSGIPFEIRSSVAFTAEAGRRYEIFCLGPDSRERGTIRLEVRLLDGNLVTQQDICTLPEGWHGTTLDAECACQGEYCMPELKPW